MAKIKMTLEQAKRLLGKDKDFDVVLVSNFPELKVRPKAWEELKNISGIWIGAGSMLVEADTSAHKPNKNVFATEKQAKSALAAAQLSQLMKAYNGDWVADWENSNDKYIIHAVHRGIRTDHTACVHHFLAFPTAELRDEFLSNFEPLIKEYFEL